MRKLVIVTGVLALAACGGEAEVSEEEAVEEEVAEVDPAVGAYTWTDDEGNEVTGYINADGTAYTEVNGEANPTIAWARNEEGEVCLSGTDDEGEEWEDCMTFGELGEDGTMEITGSDGEVDTVTKVS
ncbi:hypothetical protein OZN62_02550 [Aurantiacibacter sp. MUD11]|uniref:hypothetical protein n=1 Tax=Aurantiacibacter sp. MUD11 TaxID=3003265 RepID=UPI0022AA2404|nr:hypothetical protein [Aurantiacibacter sp. MUD11]WAT18480.1 hypothetical protein OZN62_02550 [Aurantiacibacter sp. MUD11]